jgi:hypothetical protein
MLPSRLFSTRRRKPAPDVPEDVFSEDSHWNDPNYDVNFSLPSPTRSSGTFELEPKDVQKLSSEVDTESLDDSIANLRCGVQEDYPTCVLTITYPSFPDSNHRSESPYSEVRAAVSNVDDPSMPCNTFRMFVHPTPS